MDQADRSSDCAARRILVRRHRRPAWEWALNAPTHKALPTCVRPFAQIERGRRSRSAMRAPWHAEKSPERKCDSRSTARNAAHRLEPGERLPLAELSIQAPAIARPVATPDIMCR